MTTSNNSEPLTLFDAEPIASNPTTIDYEISEQLLTKLTLLERLQVIKQEAGFYPVNRGEANEAVALLNALGRPADTIVHLNEIKRHQEKAETDDPNAAVRSVVNEYGGYAGRSRYDLTMLAQLRDDLHQPDVLQPDQSLFDFLGGEVVDGAPRLVRFLDTQGVVRNNNLDYAGFPALQLNPSSRRKPYDVYTDTSKPDPEASQRIITVLKGVKALDVRENVIDSAIGDQRNRFNFWTDRLQSARRHAAAKPVANRALAAVGVKPNRT